MCKNDKNVKNVGGPRGGKGGGSGSRSGSRVGVGVGRRGRRGHKTVDVWD